MADKKSYFVRVKDLGDGNAEVDFVEERPEEESRSIADDNFHVTIYEDTGDIPDMFLGLYIGLAIAEKD